MAQRHDWRGAGGGPATEARPAGKRLLRVFCSQPAFSSKISLCRRWLVVCIGIGFTALDFQSANPTIVKSIKQRDLLNTWLRLYARDQRMPRIGEYEPDRLEDELPDMIYYTVEPA